MGNKLIFNIKHSHTIFLVSSTIFFANDTLFVIINVTFLTSKFIRGHYNYFNCLRG